MLSRYHFTVMSVLVSLGIVANYVFPEMRVPMPWTVFLLIMTGSLVGSFYAFIGAARYSSPTLFAENTKLSRFPQPTRFASDGRMLWAAVPAKGWTFLQRWVNSAGNTAVAIFPACMLEQDSDYYPIARCKLYHLTPRAVDVLLRKKVFQRMLADLGHTDQRPLEVYFGFQSASLHPDATHVHSSGDLEAYSRNLALDERMYAQANVNLMDHLDQQLDLWQRIQGSEPAKVIVQREQEPQQ